MQGMYAIVTEAPNFQTEGHPDSGMYHCIAGWDLCQVISKLYPNFDKDEVRCCPIISTTLVFALDSLTVA